MPETENLRNEAINCMHMNEHSGFLRCYLTMIENGVNLTIPINIEPEKVKEEWANILDPFSDNIPQEFLIRLTSFWIKIVKQQGITMHDNFIKELLSIIDNKPGARINLDSHAINQITDKGLNNMPEITDTVEGHISASYEIFKNTIDSEAKTIEELENRLHDSLQTNDAAQFLSHYLSYCKFNKIPAIPKSSMLDRIPTQWTAIIKEKFQLEPAKTFLSELTSLWFYLVNLKGIPVSSDQYRELFIQLNKHIKSTQPD